MAWNPGKEVAVARDAAKALGADALVCFFIDRKKGTYGTISYGRTKAMCSEAKMLGDHLHKAAEEWMGVESSHDES